MGLEFWRSMIIPLINTCNSQKKQVTQESAYKKLLINKSPTPYSTQQQLHNKLKMSTSKLASFSLAPSTTNEKLFRKHKFTHHMVSPFEQYRQQLSSNVTELKSKYPVVDPDYIRSLLEELENNVQMVADILDEEHKKMVRNSMEQQRSQIESISNQCRNKQKSQGSKVQDVKMLRNSITKLFKKYKQQKAQKEQLSKKLAILLKQNENLKLMNRQLMNEQMQQSQLGGNQDIF